MIKSMTGYGIATLETENYTLTAEVKTLNSKFLELTTRLPRDCNDKEIDIRNAATAVLERGKAFLSIDRTTKQTIATATTATKRTKLNADLFSAYYQELKAAADSVGASQQDLMRLTLTMPDVMGSTDLAITDEAENTLTLDQTAEALAQKAAEDAKAVFQVVNSALTACNEFREREGKALAEKLSQYAHQIAHLLQHVIATEPQRIAATRQKLYDRLESLNLGQQIDNNRFEQELLYYIEKLDITEETVRLSTHLNYFQEALNNGNGKKLGFIAQEIGREINTIGSKVSEAEIQRKVVEMKEELEKIKEQSLNVL